MFERDYKKPGLKINIAKLESDVLGFEDGEKTVSEIKWYLEFINKKTNISPKSILPKDIRARLLEHLESLIPKQTKIK